MRALHFLLYGCALFLEHAHFEPATRKYSVGLSRSHPQCGIIFARCTRIMRAARLLLLCGVLLASALRAQGDRQKRFLDISWSDVSGRFHEQLRRVADRVQDNMRNMFDRIGQEAGKLADQMRDGAKKTYQKVTDRLDQPQNDEREREGFVYTGRDPIISPSVVVVDTPRQPPEEDPWDVVDLPGGFGGAFSLFGRRPAAWWRGPNVCVERKEIDEDEQGRNESSILQYLQTTSCKETETSYTCVTRMRTSTINKKYIMKRQCCHGFRRRDDGESGCEEVDLKDMVQTMREVGCRRFLDAAITVGMEGKLRNGNFTVFCPTSDALLDFEADRLEDNEIPVGRIVRSTDIGTVLASHMVEGFHRTGDFIDEQVMMSASGESGIRMNIYHNPERVIMANCAKLQSINHYATNGVVHVIDRVLPVPVHTVADIVSSDPQFTTLKGLLSKGGLVQTLRDPKGNFTVFAPTDSAFSQMDQAMLKRLLSENGCVDSVLKHHILPSVVCSSAIPSRARTTNLLNQFVTLTRNSDDKLYFDGVQMVARDIMGSNGVVHIIDGVVIPKQAYSITQALQEAKMTELLDLIEVADLKSEIESMKNVSFFAPTNEAIQAIAPATLRELREKPDRLKELLLYHITHPQIETCDLDHNKLLSSKVPKKSIRINLYGEVPGLFTRATAQCAHVTSYDNKVCGGVIHVVDKLLVPPKKSVIDVLEEMDGFGTLRKLLRETGMEETLRDGDGPYTLLAPTDEAFSRLKEGSNTDPWKSRSEAEIVLKRHILPEMLCCSGVRHNPFFSWQEARTLDGSLVPLRLDHMGQVRAGHARVLRCDSMAENGIVHVVNRVLMPEQNFGGMSFRDPFFGSLFGRR